MGEMAAGRETTGRDRYEDAVRAGYLKTDMEFLEKKAPGGVSCVTALITDGDLIVSNAGDCRAVMSSAGAAEALTSDHRPSRKDERDRIENLVSLPSFRHENCINLTRPPPMIDPIPNPVNLLLLQGGYLDYRHGLLRLHGSLAVSRGIGDGHLKQWVTAEPETRVLRIHPEFEFLILASDGLWDKVRRTFPLPHLLSSFPENPPPDPSFSLFQVSNQEAVDTVRPLCLESGKQSLLSACKKLVDLSVGRGSADDVSVMIVLLRDFL